VRSLKTLFLLAAILCAVSSLSSGEDDPFGEDGPQPQLEDKVSEKDIKAWKEWADAFASAKEIHLVCLYGKSKGEVFKVTEAQNLKEIAKEASTDLEAALVTETEYFIEVRIPGFKPKQSAVLWVAAAGEEKIHMGEIFMIGYLFEESTVSGTSVGALEGKTIPALSRLIAGVEKKWGFKRVPEEQ
jgi:hypothetical protein